MAGLVDAFCMEMLPQAGIEFLLARCTEYNIVVPEDKKDDKNHVLKLLLHYLTNPAIDGTPDHGAALFLKLYQDLGGELKNVGALVKQEPTEGAAEISYHKLRQFKINGTIGDPGQKGCVTYSSLCFQISQGEANKYTIQEIYAGVIRAIEAGNPFRDVLELEANDFDKEAFMKSLRSHFMERDPAQIRNELRKAVQSPKESAHKFACRCVALKKKVINMSAAEDIHCDLADLNATFFKTVYTGLRQQNIRNELRQTLKEAVIRDEDLLVEVANACANEEERLRKMAENEKKVNVNKVQTCDSDSDDSSSNVSSSQSDSSGQDGGAKNQSRQGRKGNKNTKPGQQNKPQSQQNQPKKVHSDSDTLFAAEVSKLTAAIDTLTSSNAQLAADVMVLKNMSSNPPTKPRHIPPQNPTPLLRPGINNGGATNNAMCAGTPAFQPRNSGFVFPSPARFTSANRPVYLCPTCIAQNSGWCGHCFKCGGQDHKSRECPLNC